MRCIQVPEFKRAGGTEWSVLIFVSMAIGHGSVLEGVPHNISLHLMTYLELVTFFNVSFLAPRPISSNILCKCSSDEKKRFWD